MTATMLRAIAERADQYRTGLPVYLLADYRFPHNVDGPFPSRAAAELARPDSGLTFGVFGPNVTPRDTMPDSTSRVVSVRVLVQLPNGRRTIEVNPNEVDALFFTLVSFDKFVVPYYSRLYGPDFARRLKIYSRVMIKRPIGHCATRACEPDPGTGRFRVLPTWDPTTWSLPQVADSTSP